MTTGIIIVALIVAFALYDYFSSKNWQMVTSNTRNETVFENRNQKYGAYRIRRDYNRNMILILLGFGVGFSGLYAATYGMGGKLKNEDKKERVVVGVLPPDPEQKDDVVEEKETSTKPEAPSAVSTLAFVAPTFTSNPADTTSTIEIPTGTTEISTVTQTGNNEFGSNVDIPIETGTGTGTEVMKDPNGVVINVDEIAYFIGGENAMNKWMMKNVRPLDSEYSVGESRIKFVVSKNGTITQARVSRKAKDCPECDAEALRLVNAMPAWEPGKVNGVPVDSYFTIPMKFR